jgi:hypothetical protein
VSRDISCPAVGDPSWSLINAVEGPRFLEISHFRHKNWPRKNLKKTGPGWNDPKACASFPQPVIPPAPLTGDAGRGCGDASRAPNFLPANLRLYRLIAHPSAIIALLPDKIDKTGATKVFDKACKSRRRSGIVATRSCPHHVSRRP